LLELIITFAFIGALVELPFSIWRIKATHKRIEIAYEEGFREGVNCVKEILKEIHNESSLIIDGSLSKDEIEELKSYGAFEIKKPS